MPTNLNEKKIENTILVYLRDKQGMIGKTVG